MNNKINLEKSVSLLIKEFPELKEILYDLGFTDIINPIALNTIARVVTIPKGAKTKNIDLEFVIKTLEQKGYIVENNQENNKNINLSNNKDLIKSYINRLNSGEDIENVRKDFVDKFEYVDASEIISAEQDLIIEGMPVEEVMKLCDVHSALFRGKTLEEQSMFEQIHSGQKQISDIIDDLGHPVTILIYENSNIKRHVIKIKELLKKKNFNEINNILKSLSKISFHYDKKGDLIYPLLNTKYGFTGPSTVMWGVDVEIRNEINDIVQISSTNDEAYINRVSSVISRVDEMIYKEHNILFPLLINTFTDDDFIKIYMEFKNYGSLLSESTYPKWELIETKTNIQKNETPLINNISSESRIKLGKGHLTQEEITHILNAIPLEISFIDKDDIVRYFNENEGVKIFKRADFSIDMHMSAVHPPQAEKMAREIIDSFKSGKKDVVHAPAMKNGELVSVKFIAVRNEKGKFLGTMELVQKLDEFENIFHKYFK